MLYYVPLKPKLETKRDIVDEFKHALHVWNVLTLSLGLKLTNWRNEEIKTFYQFLWNIVGGFIIRFDKEIEGEKEYSTELLFKALQNFFLPNCPKRIEEYINEFGGV